MYLHGFNIIWQTKALGSVEEGTEERHKGRRGFSKKREGGLSQAICRSLDQSVCHAFKTMDPKNTTFQTWEIFKVRSASFSLRLCVLYLYLIQILINEMLNITCCRLTKQRALPSLYWVS